MQLFKFLSCYTIILFLDYYWLECNITTGKSFLMIRQKIAVLVDLPFYPDYFGSFYATRQSYTRFLIGRRLLFWCNT